MTREESRYRNDDSGEDGRGVYALDELLERVHLGRFHYRLLLMCGLAFMADAMEVSLLSFIAVCAGKEWALSNAQMASITSVVFAGQIAGSLTWGPVADRYGRRVAFLISSLLISAGGLLSAVSFSFETLLLTRAIVGFGVGGSTVPFDLLAEFLPVSSRGKFLIYVEYFWTAGSLFVAGAAWLVLDDLGWRSLAFLTTLPVIASSVLSFLLLPESPRWLLLKGRVREAEAVVRDAAALNLTPLEAFALEPLPSEECGATTQFAGAFLGEYWELVRTREVRALSVPLWVVWTCFGFSYYGVILLVSRVYSKPSETAVQFDFASIFTSASSELVGVLLTAALIDRWGRVPTQALMYAVTGLALALLGLRHTAHFSLLLTASIAFASRFGAMGASCSTWVATSELYSTENRGTGHSVCSAGARVGAALSPFLVVSSLSVELIGGLLGLVNFVAVIAVLCLPETSGFILDGVVDRSKKIEISSTSRLTTRDSIERMSEIHGSAARRKCFKPSFKV